MSEADIIIAAEGVSYSYGSNVALADVTLHVRAGTFVCLLGPNGSGKTTLFRILATLLPLQQGQISVCGFDLVKQSSHVRRRLGVTFQSPAVDGRLTVAENLWCHGKIYGLPSQELKERIDRILQQLGLSDRRRSIVGELSGGLRRRVELAKGLLHEPQVLLLDEPSTGLDPAARHQFWQLVQQQRRERGMTVIATSHLMDEAETCDRILLMFDGRVIKDGDPNELKATVHGDRLVVRVRQPEDVQSAMEEVLQTKAHVFSDRLMFRVPDGAAALKEIMTRFGDTVLAAEVSRPTLEDVFLEATGCRLESAESLT